MKNCIILEILLETSGVFPVLSDYEGPCELYTEDEAAVEVDRLYKYRRTATQWERENDLPVPPGPVYQVVIVAALSP